MLRVIQFSKAVLMLCICLYSFSGWAQIKKGSKFVGVDVNFSYSHSYTLNVLPGLNVHYSTFNLGASPSVGYFISKRIALGINGAANILTSKEKLSQGGFNPTQTHTFFYSLGPFVRYYQPISEKFYLYAAGQLSGIISKQESITHVFSTQKFTNLSKGYFGSLTLGMTYFFNTHLAGDISITVINYKKIIKMNDAAFPSALSSSFSAPGLKFGLSYFF